LTYGQAIADITLREQEMIAQGLRHGLAAGEIAAIVRSIDKGRLPIAAESLPLF
jgi:hypothetical protein